MGSRQIGPVGSSLQSREIIDNGTLCRRASFPPGVTGANSYQDADWLNKLLMGPYEKAEWATKIRANTHEIFLVSSDEFNQVIETNKHKLSSESLLAWSNFKSGAETLASHGSKVLDAKDLKQIMSELGMSAHKAYVKDIGGSKHIIFKGRPGLREILTAPKYSIKNPKVISMGLGKHGAIRSAKFGGWVTMVLLTVYRVADFWLREESTIAELIGSLATDVVKILITVGASALAASIVGAAAIPGLVVVGPIVAAIAVGAYIGFKLEDWDKKYQITESLVDGLESLGVLLKTGYNKTEEAISQGFSEVTEWSKSQLDAVKKAAADGIEYMVSEATELAVDFVTKEAIQPLRERLRKLERGY